ncbi:MAG: acyl carrier protein [Terriglobia bacterium]
MDDTQTRLVRCFAAVFPELSEDQIRKASPYAVSAWDSVATLNLLTVIQEEFGIEFSMEDIDRLSSFEEILDCLTAKIQ